MVEWIKRHPYFVVIGGIVFFFSAHFFNKYYHQWVRSHPMAYCYQTFYGPANPVLIIESSRFKADYIAYYKKVEQGENASFNFPLKTLAKYDHVYVLGYNEDSTLAEVVSYFDRGARFGGSYTRAWVCGKCLHQEKLD